MAMAPMDEKSSVVSARGLHGKKQEQKNGRRQSQKKGRGAEGQRGKGKRVEGGGEGGEEEGRRRGEDALGNSMVACGRGRQLP